MLRITLTAQGSYNQPTIPVSLQEALEAEIAAHMKAYGLTEIAVAIITPEQH